MELTRRRFLTDSGTVLASVGLPVLGSAEPATPYAGWKQGPSAAPGYFPLAVWLQSPQNAARYKAAGINLYVGLWQGPTHAQLAALKAAGMFVICEQNAVGLLHKADPTIVGWMHGDEPDNAQAITDPATGKQTYGPPVPPARIVADYKRLRAADPTRPILLNLGQGVANDAWVGRGPGARLQDYETYVQGGDIVSFDVYPVAGMDRADGANLLWYVPKGVDRLVRWTRNGSGGGAATVWNCLECSRINGKNKPTPSQVRAEAWMALIHGSRGLIYFVHEFQPKFNEHALLDDPAMLAGVTALNRQIQELAPVLNSPTVAAAATATSAAPNVLPIDALVKRHNGALYVFAAAMRAGGSAAAAQRGVFTLRDLPAGSAATAEVLGEGRTIPVRGGRFADHFAPYDVHLYRITPARARRS